MKPSSPANFPDLTSGGGVSNETQPAEKVRSVLRTSKRAVDIGASIFFLVSFSWLFSLIAFGVWVTSRGPIFYSQKRLGKGGKVFRFYKFRSMIPDAAKVLEDHLSKNPSAHEQWSNFQKLEKDPRITRFGAFIRRTSLDELPQFWNVLVGDMSIVGPRPCMLHQKDLYGNNWVEYCSMRPGITGLWQVSGRNTLSYQERVSLDAIYVRNFSLAADIKIFLKTLWVVATGYGSR